MMLSHICGEQGGMVAILCVVPHPSNRFEGDAISKNKDTCRWEVLLKEFEFNSSVQRGVKCSCCDICE